MRLLFLGLILFMPCSNNDKYRPVSVADNFDDLINIYLTNNVVKSNIKEVRAIFYLTDEGCTTCNRHFSDFIRSKVSDTSLVFIIAASADRIDLTGLDDNMKQIIWDGNEGFSNLGVLNRSGAIFLEAGKIDSVITIDPEQLEHQLDWMETRLAK